MMLWSQILEKNEKHVGREEQDREKCPEVFSTRRARNRENTGRPIPLNPTINIHKQGVVDCRKIGGIMPQDRQDMKIEVVAYSGYKANERPMYFVLGMQKMEVKSVLDRWYGPEHDYFKVLADNGRVYIIKWNRIMDAWFLVRILDGEGFDLM